MRAFALFAALALLSAPALADDMLPTTTVPLINFGVGRFDVIDNAEQNTATDFRAEYRFGNPLFYVVKPQLGIEVTSDGAAGVFGTLVADWVIADHYVIAPSFSAGLWSDGDGKDLGHTIEFRSQLEAGYRFDNDMRITAAFSHISNGDLGDDNPGVELGTLYFSVPSDLILPR